MKAVVYDTETGEIQRHMRGAIQIENQRLRSQDGLLVDREGADVEAPETPSPVTFGTVPSDLTGKLVDPETVEVVDDPDYEPPRPPAEIAAELRAGDLTTEDALLELLED